MTLLTKQIIRSPVVCSEAIEEAIPVAEGHSTTFNHRLMAPPAVPHVSGRAVQTSVWTPRSIHWF